MRAGIIAVIVVFSALAGYVGWHLWRISPHGWKPVVVGLFLLWAASFFAAFTVIERIPVRAATVLYEVGNTWLIAFLYILLVFLFADIASLCHLLPKALLKDSAVGLSAVAGIVAVILLLGNIHYHHIYREEMTVSTTKPLDGPMTIVMASDLHLGYHISRTELARWVDMINAENPDMVLFCGDIIDRSMRPILEGGFEEEFLRLKGVKVTVMGNHEYFSDTLRVEQFFNDSKIFLVKDAVFRYKGVNVIGRNDRWAGDRQSLSQLVRYANDKGGFTILLDHQPQDLWEAEQFGIDFQFSGHTHRGQVWPVSWITDAIFEKSWGHYRLGDTQYYITSGLGIWGAKVRIGTRSEYLVLHLTN